MNKTSSTLEIFSDKFSVKRFLFSLSLMTLFLTLTVSASQCSPLGQACTATSDCCEGQCVNYNCTVQEATGAITRVDIFAPANAVLNDVITLKMLDENGTPVSGGSILIISPVNASIFLLTDPNGEARLKMTDEGVYKYYSPRHYLTTFRNTYVTKPASSPSGLAGAPATQGGQQAPPSVGMSLASLAPWLVGLLVLVLVVAFLVTRKKDSNKK